MKRKMFLAAASSLVLAVTTFAADVSGRWTAEVSGPNRQTQTTTFVFKVDGEKLTGTTSGRAGENPISDGTVKGDDLAFTVALRFNGSDMKLIYKGTVAGEEIRMARTREGFTGPAQQFTAKRVKD